jgi:hypothetical protein
MLTTAITHGRDGYRLRVVEEPLWAVVAETAADAFCARLGHPLCRGIWPIGFRLGQRMLSPASRRQRERWSTPLSDDQVRQVFPEAVMDLDED